LKIHNRKSFAMHITLVQTDLFWEKPEANRADLEEKIRRHAQPSDVFLLPEMFTSGFTMNAQAVAEPMHLTTFRWMHQLAQQTGAALAGSYVIRENNHFFNRFLWVQPDGFSAFYDKKHLFRKGGETEIYTSGTEKKIITWKGWKFCPMICYDLRFPVWSRWQKDKAEYDCLLYVANWPSPRHLAWETLLRARAIENMSYCVGVNRIGTDEKGHIYRGGSSALNFKGETLTDCGEQEVLQTVILEKELLENFRQQFPFHLENDEFEIG
jgi:omega-amidase